MSEIVVGEIVTPEDLDRMNLQKAARVNELQEQIVHSAQNMVQYAIEIGNILKEVKDSLEFGEWLPWVKSNLDIHPTTVQDYMRLAKANTVSSLYLDDVTSINEALKLIAPHKEPKQLPTRIDSHGNRYEPVGARYVQDGEEEYLDDEYDDEPVPDARNSYKAVLHDPEIEQAVDAFHLLGAAIYNLMKKAQNNSVSLSFLRTARETCYNTLELTFKLIYSLEANLDKNGENYEREHPYYQQFGRPNFDEHLKPPSNVQ